VDRQTSIGLVSGGFALAGVLGVVLPRDAMRVELGLPLVSANKGNGGAAG
jgi:hypothetical protein